MTLKKKIALLLLGLLLIIVAAIGLSGYFLNRLAENSHSVVQDNYRTLLYVERMGQSLDSLLLPNSTAPAVPAPLLSLERVATRQLANATETGEVTLNRELDRQLRELRTLVELGADGEVLQGVLFSLKRTLNRIYAINARAVEARNDQAVRAADDALLYSSLFAGVSVLVILLYLLQLPAYLTKPIRVVSERMRSIAAGNYAVTIEEEREDEFRDMARAFNSMAQRLHYFERSNLAQLIVERNRLGAVADHFDIPILGVSEAGTVLFANAPMLEIIRREKTEVIGQPLADITRHNDLLAELTTTDVDRQAPDRRILTIVVDNEERLYSPRAVTVVTDVEGLTQPTRDRFYILNDITDFTRKDLLKTQFMSTLSHELKTPIAAIEMGTDLLKSKRVGSMNEEQRAYVDTIEDSAGRVRRMIDELLDLSRIEAGTIELNQEVTRVADLLRDARETVLPFVKDKQIDLKVEVAPTVPAIRVDVHKLLWAVNNLLTNAIRYTERGGRILLRAFPVAGGSRVRIEVTDFGPGIEKKDQQRVFEKFVRLDRNEQEGTGLGLAISKEFVETMGGSIGVESEAGSGATFFLEVLVAR
ncbi:signal transduction histidine kinase [Neolewinella xylanilytica]|uniref:histidine kinase n=1 Tax=Neolewinella xylanilytica TaxID=1514080 RepID=A0A2S6I4M4_9BACT|nr:ATP-binding protein [Neolewinella xylanilytica]PPK86041.1 signal transduction histidine kinase [Neolewinella xylanilytica]